MTRRDIDAHVTPLLQLAQITLHRAPALSERVRKIAHCDRQRSSLPVAPVGFFHDLAGTAPCAVGQVWIVLDPRGGFRDVSAAVFNPFAKPPAVLGRLKAVERILE